MKNLLILVSAFLNVLVAVAGGDTTKIYTKNGELASLSVFENYSLKYKKIFWQDLENGDFLFVSKAGFVTVENGETVKLDEKTPDNITELTVDENYNVVTYIWKNGKRVPFEVPLPDGTRVTKYGGEQPGIYEWKKGKLKFIRKLDKKDEEEKKKGEKEADELLKFLEIQQDTVKQNK